MRWEELMFGGLMRARRRRRGRGGRGGPGGRPRRRIGCLGWLLWLVAVLVLLLVLALLFGGWQKGTKVGLGQRAAPAAASVPAGAAAPGYQP